LLEKFFLPFQKLLMLILNQYLLHSIVYFLRFLGRDSYWWDSVWTLIFLYYGSNTFDSFLRVGEQS
jgi:hypothetical protein